MLGGAYLCFEGSEKTVEAIARESGGVDPTPQVVELALNSADMESQRVSGAIRTDFILSGEIMAIALAAVANRPLAIQAGALVFVSLMLTIGVYGFVGLIVKLDDIGMHLAKRSTSLTRSFGRGLVISTPHLLRGLTLVGTAAMLWVGGGIIVHGLEHFGVDAVPQLIATLSEHAEHVPGIGSIAAWLTTATYSAALGFVLGGAVVAVVHFLPKRKD
jgi:predicted DNA repair protein MutK